jgi:hypothetical protein
VATPGDQRARVDELAAYEQRFRRAGLPLFIQGFSASTDVFNRVVPLLALVFCAEMLGAIDLDWSLAANVAAALGAWRFSWSRLGSPTGFAAARSARSLAPSAASSWPSSCSFPRSCR